MAYSKDSIEGAKKAGAIDSTFDELALGMSDEEKSALGRKLKAAGPPAIEIAEKKETVQARARKRAAAGRGAAGDGIWDRIVAFFRGLFAGVSKETMQKKKAVKESERALLAFSIPVYDPKLFTVKREFIELLAQVEQKVARFADFFNANFIVTTDDFLAGRRPGFARFVIENSLSLEQTQLLRKLKEADMAREFELKGEEGVEREMLQALKKFTDSFDTLGKDRLEEHLEFYLGMLNLRNYNFRGLLSLFRVEGTPENNPRYRDFSLEHALAQLRNLDSYLAGIPFAKLREEHYQWFERFRGEALLSARPAGKPLPQLNKDEDAEPVAETDDERLRYAADDFRAFVGPLKKLREKELLMHLVRVGEENPLYRAKPLINTISYPEKYRNLVDGCLRGHIEQGVVRLRERQVATEIAGLFEGSRSFQELPAMNRDVNDLLKKAGISGCDAWFLFTIVFNFMEKIYVEKFRKSVNTIVVEGEFRKKEMANEFSNTYYGLDELYDRARLLAADLARGATIEIKIGNFLEGRIDNPIALKKFENDLLDLDEELSQNAQSMGMALMRQLKMMESILRDFKGLRVVDLLNAKAIGGIANRNLLFAYDRYVAVLRKLEAILSRFMVVRETMPER